MQKMAYKKSPLLAGWGPILNLIWESPAGGITEEASPMGGFTPSFGTFCPPLPIYVDLFRHILHFFIIPLKNKIYTFFVHRMFDSLRRESAHHILKYFTYIFYIFYFTSVQ